MREIIFDTETTGLSPADGHRVIEIGCVEVINRVETGEVFHRHLCPERDVPEEVVRIHGLTAAFLADKPKFAAVADDFLAFIGDAPIVAHNANFDMGFINAELKRAGREPLPGGRAVDTVALARTKYPGAKHSLDALCTRFGVDRSARTLHGALLDAQLLAAVYLEMTGGRQIGFELAREETILDKVAAVIERVFRAPRPHAASEAELSRHAAFLSRLTDPLWLKRVASR